MGDAGVVFGGEDRKEVEVCRWEVQGAAAKPNTRS